MPQGLFEFATNCFDIGLTPFPFWTMLKNCNVVRCRHWWCLMASSGLLPAGCKSKDNVTPAISLQLPYSPTTHQARVLCDFRAIPCLLKYSFRHHLFLVLFRTNKAQITQGNCPNWDFFGICSKSNCPPPALRLWWFQMFVHSRIGFKFFRSS